MPLNIDKLKTDIFDSFASMISSELPEDSKKSAEDAMKKLSDGIGTAIDEFVKAGTVSVTTTGVTSTGTPTTGNGTGNIS